MTNTTEEEDFVDVSSLPHEIFSAQASAYDSRPAEMKHEEINIINESVEEELLKQQLLTPEGMISPEGDDDIY
jgi:hypothetical protein